MKISSELSKLQGQLLDVQQQALALLEENRQLKDEMRKLNDTSELRARVHFHDGAMWERKDDGSEDGPYCPNCWTENVLRRPQIRLVRNDMVMLVCTEHNTAYEFQVPSRLLKDSDLRGYRHV